MPEVEEQGAGKSHTMDFSEIAAQAESNKAPDYSQIRFEGDAVPEIVRGKTAAETLALVTGMQESLRLSEQARQQALATSVALSERQPVAAQPAPVPVEAPEPTEAELKVLYEEDQFKYHQTVAAMQQKRFDRQLSATVQPLMGSTASAAEQSARQRHTEAFEILGKEIEHVIQSELGGNKSVLAQPDAWDKLVKYTIGNNVDKFIAEKAKKSAGPALEAARQEQANNAPQDFTGRNGDSPRRSSGRLKELDATQKEICRVQGISEEDYRTYYVGA